MEAAAAAAAGGTTTAALDEEEEADAAAAAGAGASFAFKLFDSTSRSRGEKNEEEEAATAAEGEEDEEEEEAPNRKLLTWLSNTEMVCAGAHFFSVALISSARVLAVCQASSRKATVGADEEEEGDLAMRSMAASKSWCPPAHSTNSSSDSSALFSALLFSASARGVSSTGSTLCWMSVSFCSASYHIKCTSHQQRTSERSEERRGEAGTPKGVLGWPAMTSADPRS